MQNFLTAKISCYDKVMNFQREYENILSLLNDEINILKNNLISDINVPHLLKESLVNYLKAPSKHIRSVTAFLYLKALNKNIDENQILYQTSIELVHNASLIHDDVIDESIQRRGNKSLNDIFDNKLAVITGDYLLSKALKNIMNIGIPKLVNLLCETLEDMTLGEMSQYFDKYKIPTLENYILKTEQKTAKLFETALDGSLLISKYYKKNDFPKYFGIAFQIRDDLINCLTDKSDFKNGIYTAPVIFSNSETVSSEGIEKTVNLLNNYLDRALLSIDNLHDSKYKSALQKLTEIMRYEQI